MATYRQVVFMALDIMKEASDDAYYTEEHMIFLANKMRALLLERKYRGARNATFNPMSDENKQVICLDLEPTELLPDGCLGTWLKSVEKVPSTMTISEPKVSPINFLIQSNVTFIPAERMPYVGYNKWLKNIIYAAKDPSGYLYLNSANPLFINLKKVKMEGVFSDPEEAAKLSCDDDGNSNACEILDAEFPLENALVASCVELMVQELIGSRYAPEDKGNNAKDDLGEAAVTQQKPVNPAERMAKEG